MARLRAKFDPDAPCVLRGEAEGGGGPGLGWVAQLAAQALTPARCEAFQRVFPDDDGGWGAWCLVGSVDATDLVKDLCRLLLENEETWSCGWSATFDSDRELSRVERELLKACWLGDESYGRSGGHVLLAMSDRMLSALVEACGTFADCELQQWLARVQESGLTANELEMRFGFPESRQWLQRVEERMDVMDEGQNQG